MQSLPSTQNDKTGAAIRLRPLTLKDIPFFVPVLIEMQAHYDVPCPPRDEIAAELRDLPANTGLTLALLATEIGGFAAWSVQWPGPGLRRGLYLKELYVRFPFRRRGIGRALMESLARTAVAQRAARIDFTAASDASEALTFYAGIEAVTDDRRFHRISGDALTALAARGPATGPFPGPSR